jgi:hypothetical protein
MHVAARVMRAFHNHSVTTKPCFARCDLGTSNKLIYSRDK